MGFGISACFLYPQFYDTQRQHHSQFQPKELKVMIVGASTPVFVLMILISCEERNVNLEC
jgi:hypothetical protein